MSVTTSVTPGMLGMRGGSERHSPRVTNDAKGTRMGFIMLLACGMTIQVWFARADLSRFLWAYIVVQASRCLLVLEKIFSHSSFLSLPSWASSTKLSTQDCHILISMLLEVNLH